MTAPLQLRLVLHAPDLEEALALFRDALGMPVSLDLETPTADGDARVVVLEAGRATLELVNTPQRAHIDAVEVGRPVAREVRLALQVDDAAVASAAALAAGAEHVAPPTRTPWGSLNARLETPVGVQLTLFEQVEEE
ncbi:VOC family protein [Demequina phytophila]|uniref:VOC family protein n=1 Tax=Demequina phytophila TaxID=1638981 RepID=UPI000786373C|nr:VOC family protein [Demequina phytophila]